MDAYIYLWNKLKFRYDREYSIFGANFAAREKQWMLFENFPPSFIKERLFCFPKQQQRSWICVKQLNEQHNDICNSMCKLWAMNIKSMPLFNELLKNYAPNMLLNLLIVVVAVINANKIDFLASWVH